MKNRASSHLFAIVLIIIFEIVGYYAVGRAAALRGYAPSTVSAVRDLMLFVPFVLILFWLSRSMRYAGSWTLYTTAILLFSLGLLVQYRLFSDPEYGSRNKAQARAEKTEVQRNRFINQNYDAEKKQMLGFNSQTAAQANDSGSLLQSPITVGNIMTSSFTWIPLLAFASMVIAFRFCIRDDFLLWVQRNSFIIVLATLVPLAAAVATSSAGKAIGNMTPWEPSKIPFLLGFAGILTAQYRRLAQTYWGVPAARDLAPLMMMAAVPFIPFFALKDFGQMLVFGGAYLTLYLVAVRRPPQFVLFVGTVALGIAILVVGALPANVQERVPLLPTLSTPVQAVLPDRIKQRFHLWLDGFDPPATDTEWWQKDFEDALARNPRMKELAESSPTMSKSVNVDVWFDRIAFQPAQATFGIASGGMTGRGLGLGFSEVIPVADSDYIYAAVGEELGLAGGAIIFLALIVFVNSGVRIAIDARDMFTKLSAAGLTAFIGLQALVNIGGTTRALPMTGITLPFVSHGGFSLITSFAMLGMLMAFSHRNARDAQVAASVAQTPAKVLEGSARQSPVLEAVE